MSFSAHADAKGIMQLIKNCEPKNVLLVHGENLKMDFLKNQIIKEFEIECYKPANGETVTIKTKPIVPASISVELLKKENSIFNRGILCWYIELSRSFSKHYPTSSQSS